MKFAATVTCALWIGICAAGAPRAVQAQVGKSVTIVDANFATEKELSSMPHLTPPLVKGILERRPFQTMTELNALLSQSLKPEQLNELYGRLFVHLNLNT